MTKDGIEMLIKPWWTMREGLQIPCSDFGSECATGVIDAVAESDAGRSWYGTSTNSTESPKAVTVEALLAVDLPVDWWNVAR